MLEYDFEESVGYWAFMTARAFQKAMREELGPHGITFRQWQVLAWIAHEGEMNQSELARRLEVEAPTLAGILDRMERDGWIVRVESPEDRRRKLVRATERVQPVWRKMVGCAKRVRARATEGLDRRRLEETMELLRDVSRNLDGDAIEEAVE